MTSTHFRAAAALLLGALACGPRGAARDTANDAAVVDSASRPDPVGGIDSVSTQTGKEDTTMASAPDPADKSAGRPARATPSAQPKSSDALTPEKVERASGRVFVTGAVPRVSVMVRQEEGGSVRVVGNLASELRRLSGATVAVEGVPAGTGPGRGIDVRSYDVLLVDGEKPHVGVLADGDGVAGAMRLMGKDTVELAAAPEALRDKAGAKVWIVGIDADGKVQVQSFGVIREPGR